MPDWTQGEDAAMEYYRGETRDNPPLPHSVSEIPNVREARLRARKHLQLALAELVAIQDFRAPAVKRLLDSFPNR